MLAALTRESQPAILLFSSEKYDGISFFVCCLFLEKENIYMETIKKELFEKS